MTLDKDGNVWAWGNNGFGQLGKGFGYNYSKAPVRVKKSATEPLTNIVSIDAGYEHSMAIDRDDNVWVWGLNGSGQLGLGYKSYGKEFATIMP